MRKELVGALYDGDIPEGMIVIDSCRTMQEKSVIYEHGKTGTVYREPAMAETGESNHVKQFKRESVPHYFEAPPPYKRKQLRSKGKAQKLARRKNRG